MVNLNGKPSLIYDYNSDVDNIVYIKIYDFLWSYIEGCNYGFADLILKHRSKDLMMCRYYSSVFNKLHTDLVNN